MIEFMRVSSKEISPKGAADLKLVYASCTQRAAQPGRLRFATPKHFCEDIVPPEKRPDISFLSSPHKHRQLASQKIALVRARSHRHASGQEGMSISSSSAMRLTLNPPGRPDSAGRALPHVSQAVNGDRHDLGRSQFCQSHSCARSAVEVVEGKGGYHAEKMGRSDVACIAENSSHQYSQFAACEIVSLAFDLFGSSYCGSDSRKCSNVVRNFSLSTPVACARDS